MTLLELFATICGFICVYLQTKEKILAWPFGIISVSIAAYIYFHSKLYSDFGLHIIYIFLNIYGWINWYSKRENHLPSPIIKLGKSSMMVVGSVIILTSLILGFVMTQYTDADLAYLDAFTTCGSLTAQFMLARKHLQNWLVWIVVDLVACPLYIYKGLYLFAFLFFAYLLICIKGYVDWRRNLSIGN